MDVNMPIDTWHAHLDAIQPFHWINMLMLT